MEDYLAGLDIDRRTSGWEAILGAIAWPNSGVLVLTEEGVLIGFAHFCASRDGDASPGVGEVTSIYLAPETWNQAEGGS